MLAAVLLKGNDVALISVVNALEFLSAADRPVDRVGLYAKLVLDLIDKVKRVSCLSVHFVYKCKYRDMPHNTDLEQLSCLRLNAL